jgi:signal transduction histidine kinase
VTGCGNDLPRYLVEVGHEHRFRTGDDPAFAAADFDDSGWEVVTLPATWRVRTVDPAVFGWHRFRFQLATSPPGRLALDVGGVAWADEVFLNGRRIGGTGRLDGLPRIGLRTRLYAVPEGILHAGTNVLAIRVRGVPHGISGLLAKHIGLGDELELSRVQARRLVPTQFSEGLLAGLLVLSWVVVAFFPKRGRAGRATLFLLASITLALFWLWALSVTCLEAGVSPEVPGNVILAVLIAAGCLQWAFIATLTHGSLPRLIKGALAAEALLVTSLVAWPAAFGVLLPMSVLTGMFAAAVVCRLLAVAIRAGTPGAIPIAVGFGLLALSMALMLHAPQPFLAGLPAAYWGFAAQVASAILGLSRHVHELNRLAQRATEYALEAHSRERNRLARDLHDGLGQMLALLRLQMQRMGRKHDGEPVQRTFDESADHVAATLDELRRISRDLRPAPLEDRSFGQALREYAAAMASRTDIAVEVQGEYEHPLSESMGDELYRIAQECLTNCFKHSDARRVMVTLAETTDHYRMTVADDGRGLPDSISEGLGLSTIRERSELLGGRCTIMPARGGGTMIDVSVPK